MIAQNGCEMWNSVLCPTAELVLTKKACLQALCEAGVIPGSDMTPEAALTKLSYVLSKAEWSHATKKEMLQASLRGELSVTKPSKLDELDLITAIARTMNISSPEVSDSYCPAIGPVMCARCAAGEHVASACAVAGKLPCCSRSMGTREWRQDPCPFNLSLPAAQLADELCRCVPWQALVAVGWPSVCYRRPGKNGPLIAPTFIY